MKIYIPTYGRAKQQKTLAALPDRYVEKTWLVIRPEEEHLFNYPRLMVVDAKGVPAARQAVIDRAEDEVVWMMDDDLQFSQRVDDWDFEFNPSLRAVTKEETGLALDYLEDQLVNKYVAVGMDMRAMNNAKRQRYGRVANRMIRSFGVDISYLHKYDIRFDKYLYWEDFHVTLALLKLGYPNYIYYNHVTNATTNTKGGVSTYRDWQELCDVRAAFLEEHGPFAQPNDKKPSSWGCEYSDKFPFVPDVKISWLKAYEWGKKEGYKNR